MFKDEFKERYTTIPLAIHRTVFEKPMQEVISHQHKEMELILMESGTAEFYIDTKFCKASCGDALLIPPYAMHRIQMTEGAESAHLCICFDLSLLCDEALREGLACRTLTAEPLLSCKEADTAQCAELIRTAFSACQAGCDGWELCAMGSLSLLFGTLKRKGAFVPHLSDEKQKDLGKKILDYIAEHYAEKITSQTAARALFLNHSYFCRLFKKLFGCCFSKYVIAYRLEKARHKLQSTDLSVSQVALATGFTSFSYFGKLFKEKFECSPLVYRKRK